MDKRVSVNLHLYLALLGILSVSSNAATIVNGSLTGPSYTYSLIPPGWTTLFPNPDMTFNPDTEDAYGPHGLKTLSPDGGTFVAAARALTQPPGGIEGLQQTVDGLVIGENYILTFYQSNLGAGEDNIVEYSPGVTYSWNARSAWELYLDGTPTGLLSSILEPETGPLPNNTWFQASIVFTAASATQAIGFAPRIVEGDNTFLGIDGIQIAAVPISPVGWLLAPAFGALGWHRRKRTS